MLEGVSYYLPRAAVQDVLSMVARCAPGSVLAMDFATDLWSDSAQCDPSVTQFMTFLERIGEPFCYGVAADSSPMEAFGCDGQLSVDVWLGPYTIQKMFLHVDDPAFLMRQYHNSLMNLAVLRVNKKT